MSGLKSYDYDPTLNSNGVRPQPRRTGTIPPIQKGGSAYLANEGGWVRATAGQKGWRVQCDQIGTAGGYDISVGNFVHRSLLDLEAPVDLLIPKAETIRVEPIGMVGGWGQILVSKVV